MTKELQPSLIFLDAVGTLFGVKGSVGAIYAQLALDFGVTVKVDRLDRAFYQSFKSAPRMAFPDMASAEIPHYEKQWWRSIAFDTFTQLESIDRFSDFDLFFTKLYDYFATASPWYIYPEVISTLEHWQGIGIELGIISNFDTRIYPVLSALGLDRFFSSITISTEVGAAKPDAAIFLYALEKHRHHPKFNLDLVYHIGDSFDQDYQGSIDAGIKGIWLNRDHIPSTKFTAEPVNFISHLDRSIVAATAGRV